jgi:putative tryptophan/tyrosine transport system substrate-binding protein
MTRRELLLMLGAMLTAARGVRAQQKTMPVIGWLGFSTDINARPGLLQGLRELGYIEGQNIRVEYRFPEERGVGFTGPIEDLARLKVNIIVPVGFPATDAVHRAALTIPVVFVVADPIGSGFAESLAHPGGNMTGLSLAVEEQFSGKWLELLKEAAPQVSRVAYLWNPANHSSASSWKVMQGLAPKLGMTLQSVELRDPKELGDAFAAIIHDRAEGVIVDSDASMTAIQTQIVEFAFENRMPLISALRRFADAGGLITYGPNLLDLWRRAASYVDKILKGAKPADLPVEQPTRFELVVNLKTARALGLTVPPSILSRATEVIE